MIWIDFVMEGTVVMPDDALHAIGPWSRGAQIEAEDLLDLLFGIRVQQMIGDRADHLVALVAQADAAVGLRRQNRQLSAKTILKKPILNMKSLVQLLRSGRLQNRSFWLCLSTKLARQAPARCRLAETKLRR